MSSGGKPKKKTALQKAPRGSRKPGQGTEKRTPQITESSVADAKVISFFERVTDGFVALDKNWHYTYVNSKGAQLLGKKPEELIGKHIWTVFPEGVGQPFYLAYEKSMKEQIPIVFENHYEPWNRWFENRIYPSKDGISIYYTEITERKLAEARLRESEEFLSRIVETVPDGIVTVNLEGQILFANKSAERILGLTQSRITERIYNDPLWKITDVDGSPFPEVNLPFVRVIKSGETVHNVEHAIEHLGGKRVILSVDASPMRGEQVNITGMVSVLRDITEKKRNELLLVLEKKVLEMISTGETLGQVLEKIVLSIEALSHDTIASILLLDPDEVHVHYGAAPHLPEAYNQALEGAEIGPMAGSCGTAAYLKEPVIVSDIETDPLWDDYRKLARTHGLRACWSTPIINSEGKVLGTFAMYYREPRSPKEDDFALIERATYIACIAIEQSRSEASLKESDKYNRTLFELSPIGLALTNMNGRLVDVNPAFTEIIGRTMDETLNLTFWDITPEKYAEREREQLQSLNTLGRYGPYEKEYIHKDGHLVPVQLQGLFIERRGEKYIWSSVEDITERRQAEEALRRHRQMLQLFVEHAPAAIAMLDADMKYMAASRRYLEDYQLGQQDIVGQSHYDVFPEIPDHWKEIHRRCMAGAIEKAEADPFLRADGNTDWVRWEIHPWYEQIGHVGGIFLFSEVITERILAEESIKRSNEHLRALANHIESIREEERSDLAREIHDELGQMLTAIKIDIDLLSSSIANQGYGVTRCEFEDLQNIIDKTIQIVRNIAAELRPPVLSLGIIPAVEWQAREFEKRFHIPCNLQINVSEITLEEKISNAVFRTLQEALTNVSRHAKATQIKIQLTKSDARLILRIIDNGKGIEISEIENVKSLGLLGMRERAMMIGGTLKIEGTKEKGTCVTLETPLQE